MIINEECKKCQIKRNVNKYPIDATEGKITEYQYKVKEIVKNSDGLSTPQVAEKMDNLRQKLFWKCDGLYRNQTALQSINA